MARPHSPLLSVEAIVDVALALVDETGDFSFPKVARRIGVSQSALYNRIDNREHIIELMRGRLFSDRVIPPIEALPWDEALSVLVRAYRDGLAEHPRLVPLLVSQTVQDLGVVGLYENIAITLERAGLDETHIGPAIATIDYLALGAALELTAPEIVWSPPAGEFPALHRAATHWGSIEERAEAAFGFGLDVLIAGVRAKTLQKFY